MRSFILALFLLVGCGSSGLPLANAVVQPGDFSAPYKIAATAMPWRLYPGIPVTPNVAYFEIIEGSSRSNEVGHITAVQYQNTELADTAYVAIRKEAELGKSVFMSTFGETGSQSGPSSDWNASDVFFRRCNTIVHVSLTGDTLAQLVTYAQKVDTRLQPVVCK